MDGGSTDGILIVNKDNGLTWLQSPPELITNEPAQSALAPFYGCKQGLPRLTIDHFYISDIILYHCGTLTVNRLIFTIAGATL